MRTLGLVLVLTIATWALSLSTASAASTFTVSGTTDPTPVPACAGTVCPSLRGAIAQALGAPGSTVQLGTGTYTLGRGLGQVTGTGDLSITAGGAFTLAGAGSGATTIQQTDGQDDVLDISGTGPVTISGLTVTGAVVKGANAAATGDFGQSVLGAGIGASTTAGLTLSDVTITHNTATGGNGHSGTSTDIGSGGDAIAGLDYDGPGALAIIGSRIDANVAAGGNAGPGTAQSGGGGTAIGGMEARGANVTISNSSISGNQASGGTGATATGAGHSGGSGGQGSGAMFVDVNSGQALAIAGSVIDANTMHTGTGGAGSSGADGGVGGISFGGAAQFNAGLTMSDSTVSGNVTIAGSGGAGTHGGAGQPVEGSIRIVGGFSGTVVNSTITDNSITGGPGGAPGGSDGQGTGGGLDVSVLTLAGDTLSGNSARSGLGNGGAGGNVTVNTLTIADTIITAGFAAPTSSNCVVNTTTTDLGHNLESTTPDQCRFTAAAGDLIGVDPVLNPLIGSADLLIPAPGSPAFHGGGACVDASLAGNPLLTVDQRGLPRSNPCTIGAVEPQPPSVTTAPSISGSAVVGQTLTCATGTWAGDGPLTIGAQWLRDGAPISGAASSTYVIQAADAGHALSCQVTAIGGYGQSSATTAALAVAVPTVVAPTPVLSAVSESHTSWRTGARTASISKAKPKRKPHHKPAPVGTTFSFTINTAATVTLTFTHTTTGRKVGTHCLTPTKANRHRHACTRTVTDGTLSLKATKSGAHRISFQGHISAKKKLGLGRYTVSFKARTSSGKSSNTKTLHFTIVHS